MGGCFSVSLSCDQAVNQVSQCLCVKQSYIHNIEDNLSALETTMEDLKARRDDLSRRVDREENNGLRRRAQVQVVKGDCHKVWREKEWLEGVEWEDEATKARFLPSCIQQV
ncbi:hypothetical protein Bca52824_059901 [Brassica carinata]|uniref:Uncharacterized protein n=1 Tax=Brassica carinata TaxID=52824 RepID=A0A8X7QWH4_BRACI|nr:hypothetical protein Bca52824_059901 [Brassica carinata]